MQNIIDFLHEMKDHRGMSEGTESPPKPAQKVQKAPSKSPKINWGLSVSWEGIGMMGGDPPIGAAGRFLADQNEKKSFMFRHGEPKDDEHDDHGNAGHDEHGEDSSENHTLHQATTGEHNPTPAPVEGVAVADHVAGQTVHEEHAPKKAEEASQAGETAKPVKVDGLVERIEGIKAIFRENIREFSESVRASIDALEKATTDEERMRILASMKNDPALRENKYARLRLLL